MKRSIFLFYVFSFFLTNTGFAQVSSTLTDNGLSIDNTSLNTFSSLTSSTLSIGAKEIVPASTTTRSFSFTTFDNGSDLALSFSSFFVPTMGNGGGTVSQVMNISPFRVYIPSKLGIGVLTPDANALLDVNGRIKFGNTEFIEDGGNNNSAINGDLIPFNEASDYDLGGDGARWDDIFAKNGVINTSDEREKSQIEDLKYGLKEILSLKPVQFQWKRQPESGVKLGLIAQDVQKVIKEVVKTYDYDRDENGNLVKEEFSTIGIYYSDLIPVVIQGMQEQQEIIETEKIQNDLLKQEIKLLNKAVEKNENQINQQASQLEQLQSLVEQLLLEKNEDEKNSYDLSLRQKAELSQNQPNPFNANTIVEYFIPKNIKNAVVQVSAVDGKILGIIKIQEKGKGQVEIKAHTYAAGTYYYSLILDGQVFETKRMVLTK